ncbi:MAG TPA: hypothetical protein DCG53_05500, partial [Syntrophus sp. (in: bacteria)]|nr:hypothetical protein [Syntrophus sp. (in: bacteria)]
MDDGVRILALAWPHRLFRKARTIMLKFERWDLIKRKIRRDDLEDLGVPTGDMICRCIDEGKLDLAKELAQYFVPESKGLHDLYVDWTADIFDKVAKKYGEEAMFELLRATQSTWMMRRTWSGLSKMEPFQRLILNGEIFRAHRCGPRQMGELTFVEDENKYELICDPCGSGGRIRRGDPVDGTPSRLGKPYNFGVTSQPYWWSWSQAGVPYYCIHCAMNEILMMEWGGWPLWVTEYTPDAEKPCAWHFYKTPQAIPEKYWT